MGRVDQEDQAQFFLAVTKHHFNSYGELIWVSVEYAGNVYKRQIVDSAYIGGVLWTDIVRTITQTEVLK